MAYDPNLADRIRIILKRNKVNFYEKEMMGGITWMVNEKMCVGIFRGDLMARIDPDESENLLANPGVQLMQMGGKAMKGYLIITPEVIDAEEDLEFWIIRCLEFNPKAKASKKKKK